MAVNPYPLASPASASPSTHRPEAFTLPETTRASFGPTVWQFPILAALKTCTHTSSTYTKLILVFKHLFFPTNSEIFSSRPYRWIFLFFFFFQNGDFTCRCVKLKVMSQASSAGDFQNKVALTNLRFKWAFLVLFLMLLWSTYVLTLLPLDSLSTAAAPRPPLHGSSSKADYEKNI